MASHHGETPLSAWRGGEVEELSGVPPAEEGLTEKTEIHRGGATQDVEQVGRNHLFESPPPQSVELPDARDTGANREACSLPFLERACGFGWDGPGAYE